MLVLMQSVANGKAALRQSFSAIAEVDSVEVEFKYGCLGASDKGGIGS
jgi:hypothetical protein